MKKIILTLAVVLTAAFANAQDMKFGVRGGIDMVSAKTTYSDGLGNSVSATASTTGFYAGGFVNFAIADKFTIEPGIAYHAASKDGTKLNFLSVPVTFKYLVAEKINILAGPALFYNMDSAAKDKTTFNLDLGASYDITENFFVDPRYSLGLSGDTKVSHFLIGVGYRF
jgi:opacity protein-like surface antigen